MSPVADIYSKEEARAMPPARRPICYRVPSRIYHAAFEAAGHASLCWKPKPEGVFDSDEASQAALNLLFVVAEELERLGVTFEALNDQEARDESPPDAA